MKIGIVTFHRATNYSAILQAYALVSYPKSLAHETEFIDCKSEAMVLVEGEGNVGVLIQKVKRLLINIYMILSLKKEGFIENSKY